MTVRKLTREERVAQAQRLCATSLTQRQVAELLGIGRGALRNLLYDPDGSQARARKERYRGTCEACGAKTDGSNGRAKAPKLCHHCAPLALIEPCPSAPSYQRGCRCDGCREANAAAHRRMADRVRAEGRIPHGTEGAYRNYRCRCRPCTDAAWAAYKARGLRLIAEGRAPHGRTTTYRYGCRCDACRAAESEYHRASRARAKALA